MSFVSWSSTRIFQTGGLVAAEALGAEAVFPNAETVEGERSMGLLRLSMESNAFVCACCTLMGEVAYGDGLILRSTGCDIRRRTCLSTWLAMVGVFNYGQVRVSMRVNGDVFTYVAVATIALSTAIT